MRLDSRESQRVHTRCAACEDAARIDQPLGGRLQAWWGAHYEPRIEGLIVADGDEVSEWWRVE